MTKYKGYYIDHVIFNSKADIDAFLRDKAIKAYKRACKWFAEQPTMQMSIHVNECAERLHRDYGFTWEALEKLEIESYNQAC